MRVRVQWAADGEVLVRTGKVELGQGLHTALAQIAADALGVALARVRMLPVDTDESPDEGVTSGSLSVQDAGRALRQACAELRPGANVDHTQRCVGESLQRTDLPRIFAGLPHFIHDLQPDGLLHGRVLHPPRHGAQVLGWNEAAARDADGLLHLQRDGSLFGLIAATGAEADRALERLAASVRWRCPAPEPEGAETLWRLPATSRVVGERQGAEVPVARSLQARYSKPWIAHASLGPSCALACWHNGESLHVWSHSQGVFNLRRDLALAFGVEARAVRVTHVPGAGCYGHNGADDVAFDAAWLARATPGRPVRVLWSRADELSHSPFGPAMRVELEAGLDADGRIVRWRHDVWSPGHSRRPGRSATPALLGAWQVAAGCEPPASIDMPLEAGGGAERNALPGYDFAAWRVRCHTVATARRSSRRCVRSAPSPTSLPPRASSTRSPTPPASTRWRCAAGISRTTRAPWPCSKPPRRAPAGPNGGARKPSATAWPTRATRAPAPGARWSPKCMRPSGCACIG